MIPEGNQRVEAVTLTAYKVLHLFGVFMMFVALGGASIHAASGGERNAATRRLVGILHGLGLLVSLTAGFGMLARLGMSSLFSAAPGWIIAKIVLWLLLGGLIALPYRKPSYASAMAIALPLLGLLAAWLALYKPF